MKKPFERITVYVEYRCTSEGVPDDRLLRARVVETLTPRGGICRDFGSELVAPRKITDTHMSELHAICLASLRKLTRRVVFQYEPLLGLTPEEYPISEVA